MKYGRIFILILVLVLAVSWAPGVSASEAVSGSSASSLGCSLEIPLDNNLAPDVLVAGHSWERARVNIENPGTEPLYNITVFIKVPEGLETDLSTQPYLITKEGQKITAEIGDLAPGQSASLLLDVKPPASIEFKKQVAFTLQAVYSEGVQKSEHKVSIIPPPSWMTYFTILASLLLFVGILAAIKHSGALDLFSTVDLITIALLAAVIAVVFRYLSKLINLGWFDGLVIAIPTVVLMVVALQLVRKPGTATLLFTCVLLISMVVWGSHIMWLGFYLAEGVVVDLQVFLFRMDYADRRLTAVIYGVSRGVVSTLVFYMLYAPVEWKISYAPWYIGLQLAFACAGGLIGGLLGYDTAVKMSGARL
ncbi:hypothetical protein EO98_16770 [Methanosarcina sp. 2.H.T.1A.6]|uniref:hypothetical protein n=1 Tax=unclassified Methanosarcina TaxID=2644672 RepID=UPI000620E6B1|nr:MULTISPECIES: hypothetical protein [unclassified Methanosarcina]KKG13419.1 hypothetical protein EO97_10135 [Methanosarcina sp. 2.H.T.1A.15]KKG15018.1 hypothetical protein EO94_03825 [Methanosarcina sp. 2.H.T.1A.3]KKG20717.1 hypothetical protein EO96_17815 [Methanosarcina sp. 2.H.T.1A.8]KKG22034.1 hypothetical protein EO98_16770 [Methanosarcina sp. 2.H.T.1A.6]